MNRVYTWQVNIFIISFLTQYKFIRCGYSVSCKRYTFSGNAVVETFGYFIPLQQSIMLKVSSKLMC